MKTVTGVDFTPVGGGPRLSIHGNIRCSEPRVCSVRRIRTNTPLQALVTLNDPVYVEAARNLAARIRSDDGSTIESQLIHGFRLCVARHPTEAELDRSVHSTTTLNDTMGRMWNSRLSWRMMFRKKVRFSEFT